MTDRSYFKLLIRAIGVFLIASAVPQIINLLGEFMQFYFWTGPGGYGYEWPLIGSAIACLCKLAMGFYLFFGGAWIFRRCTRDLEGHCFTCGYAMHSVPGDTCPECGTKFRGLQDSVNPARAVHPPAE